jgi:hypothetical protein
VEGLAGVGDVGDAVEVRAAEVDEGGVRGEDDGQVVRCEILTYAEDDARDGGDDEE